MSKTLLDLLDEKANAARLIQLCTLEIYERYLTKAVLKALQKHFDGDWNNLDFALNASGQVPMMNIEASFALDGYEPQTKSVDIPLDELELGTAADYINNIRLRLLEERKAAIAKRVAEDKAYFEANREKREKRELKRLLKKYPQGK